VRRFGGTSEVDCCLILLGFFFGLPINAEGESDRIFRNVDMSPLYMLLQDKQSYAWFIPWFCPSMLKMEALITSETSKCLQSTCYYKPNNRMLGFFHDCPVDSEGGGDRIIRNVKMCPIYMLLQAKRSYVWFIPYLCQ
jgi:hypothetical protein